MMSRADAELVLELHNYDRTAGTRSMPEPARSEVKAALRVVWNVADDPTKGFKHLYLDDADFKALKAWADARGWTLSQAARVAFRALTHPEAPADPLLAASGMIDGLPTDLSARFDDYLTTTFVAEPKSPHGQTRRRRARKTVRR
jgi:hypothetical protein